MSSNQSEARHKILEQSRRYPAMTKRAFAFLIDYILGSIVVSIIPMILMSIVTGEKALTVISFTAMPVKWQGISCGIALLTGIWYYCLYPMKKEHRGQTPGKRIMKIRIEKDGGLTYKAVLLRELMGSFLLEGETAFPSAFGRYFLYLFLPGNIVTVLSGISVILSAISVILAVCSPKHRMLHDFVGGTVVVNS